MASLSTVGELQPYGDELAAIRHELHRHPELAFQEHRTGDFIAARLQAWGFEVARGIGRTGLVATLRHGDGRRSLGFRADMDALAIHEATGAEWASCNDGLMHACGHDGHTAMLLGAARHLSSTRRWRGTLNLIFQPAEEKGFDSGAQAMLADGLFTRFPCDHVFALHNHPGAPVGRVMWRPGPFMAAGDRVFIHVAGRGGHAARPHQAVDPVVAAAAIVMNLQSIVSRNVDPHQAAVVTVGRLRAGDAVNVIPSHAELGVSVRSFDEGLRRLLLERITEIAQSTARAHGASARVEAVRGYPVVHNDTAACELARRAADGLHDAGFDDDFQPLMGSEDFACMLQACPGALLRLGNGTDSASLHSPLYDFNDDNLAVGAALFSRIAELHLR